MLKISDKVTNVIYVSFPAEHSSASWNKVLQIVRNVGKEK